MSEPKPKSFAISKRAVWEAWLRVKANRGAAGVDEQSIAEFEAGPFGEPFQALESALVGELLPAAGACGRDTEARRQLEGSRGADRRGQGRADGRVRVPGAWGGASFSPRLLWVSAGPLGAGRGWGLPGALLASGLGSRFGPEVVFRQRSA